MNNMYICDRKYKSSASNFLLENVLAITMKFMWMIHTLFAIMRLFFHKAHVK
jgi:hypothetical protein